MPKIHCKDLTNTECDFVAEGETAEEAKSALFSHGAESELHKEKVASATPEDKAAFAKQVDEYLEKQ